MLWITPDVYSGRPNPIAEIPDESEARATLRELSRDLTLLADASQAAAGGLGLRGFWVESLNDELAHEFDLPARIFLPAGSQVRGGGRTAELAERLIGLIDRGQAPSALAGELPPLDDPLRELLRAELTGQAHQSSADQPPAPAEESADVAVTCTIEFGTFNPGFWNNDPNVQANNNCYNYASNWRTNTFAQPGRGCGSMYTQITCAEVTRAALCDGMHHRFDCFPDAEKPRYLVALVVIPGGGDYHWFRKQSGGFWGHKPGGTAARNYDNSGNLITNPETANRGPYTIFCGYFYGCNSQQEENPVKWPAPRSWLLGVAALVLLALAAGIALAVWTGPRQASTAEARMYVEVDLYSGRPNPGFALGPGETDQLGRRVDALPGGDGGKQGDGLGYRGLRVRPQAGPAADTIDVFDGHVVVRSPGGTERRLRDPGRALERWLVSLGAGSLDPAVVSTLRTELGG